MSECSYQNCSNDNFLKEETCVLHLTNEDSIADTDRIKYLDAFYKKIIEYTYYNASPDFKSRFSLDNFKSFIDGNYNIGHDTELLAKGPFRFDGIYFPNTSNSTQQSLYNRVFTTESLQQSLYNRVFTTESLNY